MKKLFSIIYLMWITITTFAQINHNLSIETTKIKFEKIGEYTHVTYGSYSSTDNIGHPNLPVIYKRYAIPLDAQNLSLQTSINNIETLSENIIVYPVQYPQAIRGPQKEFVKPDETIYQSNDLYPCTSVEILSDENIMGYRIITIAVYPIVYQPLNGILQKREINYSLNYESKEKILFHSLKLSEKRAKSIQKFIASLVENSSDVLDGNVFLSPMQKVSASELSVQKDIKLDYLIITNENLKNEFQRLADWKTKKGVPTIVKTVEEIDSEYIGADLVDKIKNFIVDFGKQWGNEGQYLLLGGDTDIIPTRQAKSWNRENEHYSTDACYVDKSFKIKDWDNFSVTSLRNRNIFMGRIPVTTISEAKKIITRLIHYEKADLEINYSYLNNYLLTNAFLKDNYVSYNYIFEYFDDYVKEYAPVHVNTWYLYDHFNCSCPNSIHRYLEYNREFGSEFCKNNLLNILRHGTEHGFFHLTSYNDHGHSYSLGTSQHNKGEVITVGDIKALDSLPFQNIILTESCNTANFSEDCIGENFLKKNTLAYIGNTDYGNILEYNTHKIFLEELYSKNNYNIGNIYTKILYKNKYTAPHRFHLLGDPEMPVWTNVPQNLNVTVSPINRIVASWQEPTTIKIKVNNLPTGDTATVCIMKDTEVYRVMDISDTDEHSFQCTPLTAGTMHVTVTAHNFRPHETAIPVEVNAPTLSIENVEFLSGNDGIISSGEDVQLRVTLKNNGTATISDVEATMGTTSPYITFVRNQLACGEISGGATKTFTNTFRFNVSADAPEILRNDFNGVTLHLMMEKGNSGIDVDTFRVDMLRPKYKFVSHKRTGLSNLAAGNTYTFTSEIANLGKINTVPRMEIIPETSGVDTIVNTGNGFWRLTLASDYQSGTSVKLRVNLYGENILSDSQVIEMLDNKLSVAPSSINIREDEHSVTLYWATPDNAHGYHIYRSTTLSGTYTRMNKMPLTDGFFIDENLDANTTYYYKVSAVNLSLVEGNMSSPIEVHTLCATMEGFPTHTGGLYNYMQTPTTVDFDYDGKKEIVAMGWDANTTQSKAVVFHSDGTEPYDTGGDMNIANGFVDLDNYLGTPTVSDIYGTGEPCVIAVPYVPTGKVLCYSSLDKNGDNRPDSLWATPTGLGSWENAVVTDIDSPDGKGQKEIITVGNSNKCKITVLDCNGNIQWQSDEINNYNTAIPAVADLDNDGYKEIISGNGTSLYIWKHDGTAYGNSTVFFTSPNGENISSAPIVCDFDGDGSKDIIVASCRTSDSRIFVIKQDGTCLNGFNGSASSASVAYPTDKNLNHSLAVGDIDNDGSLEVVALGKDYVKAWNHDGSLCFSRYLSGVFSNKESYLHNMSPALADVDGDEAIDIVFSIENKIHALNNQGNDLKGFPLTTSVEVRKGVTVSDIDNDGLNEVIAGDVVGKLYVWKTLGKSSAIEWGRAQFDTENTSEYVSNYQDPWVITTNTTWNGGTFTNDIIIRSGTFVIPQGTILNMRKPYRIYVLDGGTLNVIGGRITNADIVVKSGGRLNVAGNSQITLRTTGGKLKVDKGAILNMPLGTIH